MSERPLSASAPAAGIEPERLNALLEQFPDKRVLIVGDCMLDEYISGVSTRISPEAPVMVVEHRSTTYAAGGASNVAANVVCLAGRADIAAVVGQDANADILKEQLRSSGVGVEGIVVASDRPTTLKTRIIAQNQQVVRVDREVRAPVPPEAEVALIDSIRAAINHVDGIILSDYAKGVLTERVVAVTVTLARAAGKPVFVNAKPANISHFQNVDLISVNQSEAEEITALPLKTLADVEQAGQALMEITHCRAVLITRGGDGLSLFNCQERIRHVPALRQEVFDVAGAGDSVIAAAALARVAGADWDEAVILANWAGHAKVRKRGVVPVSREEIQTVFRMARNGATARR